MGQVTLPPELDIPQGHGKVPWIVRAVWEEHSGWFRYESTTELYDVPPSAIWPELTELAGGTDVLLERAHGPPRRRSAAERAALRRHGARPGARRRRRAARSSSARSSSCSTQRARELQRGPLARGRDPRHGGGAGVTHPRLSVSEMCTYPLAVRRRARALGRTRRPPGRSAHQQGRRLRPRRGDRRAAASAR